MGYNFESAVKEIRLYYSQAASTPSVPSPGRECTPTPTTPSKFPLHPQTSKSTGSQTVEGNLIGQIDAADWKLELYYVSFPKSIPQSCIVFSDTQFLSSEKQSELKALADSPRRQKVAELRMRAMALFEKYIAEGTAIYEINIPFRCRRDIADSLCSIGGGPIDDSVWDEEEELNQLLNLFAVFGSALRSQYQLLSYSFSRFKQTPAYERLSEILQKDS